MEESLERFLDISRRRDDLYRHVTYQRYPPGGNEHRENVHSYAVLIAISNELIKLKTDTLLFKCKIKAKLSETTDSSVVFRRLAGSI